MKWWIELGQLNLEEKKILIEFVMNQMKGKSIEYFKSEDMEIKRESVRLEENEFERRREAKRS